MKFRIISFHFRFSLVPKYNSFFWMLIFLSCFNAVCLFDECFFAECLFSLAAFMQYAFLLNAFLLYAYFSSCFFAVCFSAECLCAVCFSAECFSADCFFVAQPYNQVSSWIGLGIFWYYFRGTEFHGNSEKISTHCVWAHRQESLCKQGNHGVQSQGNK